MHKNLALALFLLGLLPIPWKFFHPHNLCAFIVSAKGGLMSPIFFQKRGGETINMKKTISFVIPVYNEEDRLNKTFKALKSLILPAGLKLESVIFVDDGSTDATASLISKFQKQNTEVKLISYKQNKGKGYAVKTGMLQAKSDYNLFFDADMSTPLTELKKFVPFFEKGYDAIVGTRKNGESTVIKHQPLLREKLGKGFTLITQVALNSKVTDFTCGFKAFSRKATEAIFPKCTIDRWGYDAEIIFLAQKLKLTITEKSVLWANDERTKVQLYKAIPQTLSELFRIRVNHSLRPLVTSIKLGLGLVA